MVLPRAILACCERLKPYCPPSKPTIFVSTCITWIFCILSVSRCTFFLQESLLNSDEDMEMGLFSRSVYDTNGDLLGCVSYTNQGTDFIDDMFKVGRAFAIIAALCSSVVLLFVCSSILFSPRGCEVLWSAAGFYSAAGTVGQMFSFFVLNSQHCQSTDHTCSLSAVGKLAVVNVLLMAGLSVKLFWDTAPTRPWVSWYKDDVEDSTVTTHRSGSQNTKKKETLNVVDPFTAEFVSSDQQNEENETESEEAKMVEMDMEETQHHKCAGSVTSNGSKSSQQSAQESLASTIGIQSRTSFRLATMGLTTVVWIISVFGVHHCTYMLVGPAGGDKSDFSGLGLFSRAAYYKEDLIGCLAYPEKTVDRFDQSFQTGRTFGVISALLVSLIFVLTVLQLFVRLAKDEIWLVIRILLPCATVSQLLVFFVYRTETCTMSTDLVECRPGSAGIVVIVNIFLMVCMSVAALLIPPPPRPLFRICRGSDPLPPETQQNVQRQASQCQKPEQYPTVLPSHPAPTRPAHQFRSQMHPIPEVPSTDIEEPPPHNLDNPTTNLRNTPQSPPKKSVRIAEEATETITVHVEYNGNEKKTIKTLTHPDGSQTITTTIEELSPENDEFDDDEEEFSQMVGVKDEVKLHQLEDVSLDEAQAMPTPGTVGNLRSMFESGLS